MQRKNFPDNTNKINTEDYLQKSSDTPVVVSIQHFDCTLLILVQLSFDGVLGTGICANLSQRHPE
jgi:hypothetical protein